MVSQQHVAGSGETSLTNPLFTLNKLASNESSELVSLPPDRSSPDKSRSSNNNDGVLLSEVLPTEEVDFHNKQLPSSLIDELFVERDIVVTPLEDGDRYQEINALVSSILHLYKPIVQRGMLIRKALTSFKAELGLTASSSISQCFSSIRAQVPTNMRVELLCAGTEPIKIKVEEIIPSSTPSINVEHILSEDVRRCIVALNSALAYCQKFKGEKELKLADIQCKLDDLHLMPLTREGQVIFDACNCAPTHLEEMSSDIERLHQQLYEARHLLRPT